MTPRRTAALTGLAPHFKVRVVLPGVLLHLACFEEPAWHGEPTRDHPAGHWCADWVRHPDYGDTVGWIDWTQLVAITWRWTGEAEPDEEGDMSEGGRGDEREERR